MKIGLISINMYSKRLNFACPLHTFAFQQFLLSEGIQSTIIDYKPVYYNNFNLEDPASYYSNLRDRLRASGKTDPHSQEKLAYYDRMVRLYEPFADERRTRFEKFRSFIEANYIKTDSCYDSDLLEVEDPGFDCYICVTDVIWKYEPGHGFDRGFFLGSKSMQNKCKIAYAASRSASFFSDESYTPPQLAEFLHYIQDMDFLSVREESLKRFIESNSHRKASLVLDPVLLNDVSLYDSIAIKPREENYVLLYYVEESADDTIEHAAKYALEHDMTIIELADIPDTSRLDAYPNVKRHFKYDIGVEEWLGYIKYAERIFTNSFHGTCLSILFSKKLFVGHRDVDKIDNLLELTGLSQCRLNSHEETEHLDDSDIDYEAAHKLLAEQRDYSKKFILDAIHACEQNGRTLNGSAQYDSWIKEQHYPIIYHSGGDVANIDIGQFKSIDKDSVKRLPSGNVELCASTLERNDGSARLSTCGFNRTNKHFIGWKIRLRIDNRWFWLAESNSQITLLQKESSRRADALLIKAGNCIPVIPANRVSSLVAEAIWITDQFQVRYNSGKTSVPGKAPYRKSLGTVEVLKSGSIEFAPHSPHSNDGVSRLVPNKFKYSGLSFVGWNIRLKVKNKWYWLLENGDLEPQSLPTPKSSMPRMVIADRAPLPVLSEYDIDMVVAVATWKSRR